MARITRPEKSKRNMRGSVLSAFDDACGIVHERGKPLKVLIADALERDPIRVLAAVARLLPPERPTIATQVNIGQLHLAALQAAGMSLEGQKTTLIEHNADDEDDE